MLLGYCAVHVLRHIPFQMTLAPLALLVTIKRAFLIYFISS
jgi:hypothetical protein